MYYYLLKSSHLFIPILCWDWLTGGDLPEGKYIRSYFIGSALSPLGDVQFKLIFLGSI